MDECAACGATVDGYATYCDACSTDAGDGDSNPGRRGRVRHSEEPSYDAPSPVARGVGALLVAAVLLGGFVTLQSLRYLPQVLSFYAPLETVGYLLNQLITIALLVAFAVMAKRLLDGTADADRYGRLLKALAVASVASGVVVTTTPERLSRWLPTFVDPGYVVLNVVARYTYPDVFVQELGVLLLGIVGASVTFAAGTRLRRT